MQQGQHQEFKPQEEMLTNILLRQKFKTFTKLYLSNNSNFDSAGQSPGS